MSQNPASKIHTVTRAYLAGWAPEPKRLLQPHHTIYGQQKLVPPAGTGYTIDWWGNDPDLNERCEKACAGLENRLPEVLATAAVRWPLDDPGHGPRGLLAQFIALHTLRSNAAKTWVEVARENSLDGLRAEWTGRAEFARLEEIARSDVERAERLLTLTNKVASLVGSMNWALFRFDKPWLITTDHPVCPVPLMADGEAGEVAAMPTVGWANLLEIRFPITPYLGLVCSWRDAPDPPVVSGTWDQAANFNAGLRAQAETWWYRVPGPMVPFPGLIFRDVDRSVPALAPRVFPGYSSMAAHASKLRAAALEQVNTLVETRNDSTMVLVRPSFTSREPARTSTARGAATPGHRNAGAVAGGPVPG